VTRARGGGAKDRILLVSLSLLSLSLVILALTLLKLLMLLSLFSIFCVTDMNEQVDFLQREDEYTDARI